MKPLLLLALTHQLFVTTVHLTYGEGLGIAGLKCRAITYRMSCRCRGNDRVLTLGSLPQGDGMAKSEVLTSSLPPGGGAHSRALKVERS